MRRISALLPLAAILLAATASAAPFTYEPAGELIPGSGTGRVDDKVYAPGMRFPIELAPVYANSQVYMNGGMYGPGGGQCDAVNYSYPWMDNYCEKRSWDMPLCPGGTGHQGQDLRPSTCDNDKYWCVAAVDGKITNIGSYSVYLTAGDGTRHDYLHMSSSSVSVSSGQSVARGAHLGRVSNNMGGTPTTIHLHYNIKQDVAGVGFVYVPPYMSLVKSYEALLGISATDPSVEEAMYQAHVVDSLQNTDLNGDGRADLCARAAAGITCHTADGSPFGDALTGPAMSDDNGWDDASNYTTFRMADFDGDGLADICARANAALYCWYSTGTGFGTGKQGPALSDDSGWNKVEYYSTLRVGDFTGDGKADICLRAAAGVRCHASNGQGFGEAISGPALADSAGWNAADKYATLRMGDVNGDGKADLCARNAAGMKCWLSDGTGFPTAIDGPAWSDDAGWKEVRFWSTIRLADIDGDGRADLCARSASDFRCHLSKGTSFGEAIMGPAWADASGWDDPSNYSTIRLGDLDADGDLDVCARANAGVVCSAWDGGKFGAEIKGPEVSDTAGWNKPELYRTLQMADLDGDRKTDLCGRSDAGVVCWKSEGSSFGAAQQGPAWSDASGWKDVKYYSTLRLAGTAPESVPDAGLDSPADGPSSDGAFVAQDASQDVAAESDSGRGAATFGPSDDTGCGCRTAGVSGGGAWFLAALSSALAAGARRRQVRR